MYTGRFASTVQYSVPCACCCYASTVQHSVPCACCCCLEHRNWFYIIQTFYQNIPKTDGIQMCCCHCSIFQFFRFLSFFDFIILMGVFCNFLEFANTVLAVYLLYVCDWYDLSGRPTATAPISVVRVSPWSPASRIHAGSTLFKFTSLKNTPR